MVDTNLTLYIKKSTENKHLDMRLESLKVLEEKYTENILGHWN